MGSIQICELPRSHTNCRGCVTTCLAVENSAGPETHMLGLILMAGLENMVVVIMKSLPQKSYRHCWRCWERRLKRAC